MNPAPGVTVENSSLVLSLGGTLGSWFGSIGSSIGNVLSQGLLNAKNLLKNMVGGAKELFAAIARGNWKIFEDWLKEDPIAVTAGAAAVILIGGVVVGAVGAGVAAIAGAIGGAGIFGGITLAGVMPQLVNAAVTGVQTIYNFDFNKSDDALLKELQQGFVNFSGIAGESLGRSLAGFIIGKDKTPKLTVNMRATSTMFMVLEDENEVAEEILEELSTIGWAVLRLARQALFTAGYINFRKWAKANIKSGIPWVDKAIASWGEEGGKPWILSEKVNQFVQAVGEQNAALGNFLEGLSEGFGEGMDEFIRFEYGR